MGSMFRIPMMLSDIHDGRVEHCHFSDSESVCNILITDGNNWHITANLFDGVGRFRIMIIPRSISGATAPR